MVTEAKINSDQEDLINNKVAEVASFAEMIPGVIIVHELPGFYLRYMSPLGLELLAEKWENIKGMSGEEYHQKYFNSEFAAHSVPLIANMIEQNTNEVISYFQQVRTSRDREWDWYMSITKILLRDAGNSPLLSITVAMKIDAESYFTAKAARLLEENRFLRNNHDKFSKLTNRERQILKLMVLGKSASQIAKELNITTATAETHRKKVKQKLSVKNSYDLGRYAHAFDLFN
jgi:DNA-binding CsgD family transcriptional regulator